MAKKKGLSANAQWGLLVGVAVLIVGAIVFNGVRDAADDGGAGVIASEAFDLPNLQNLDDPNDRNISQCNCSTCALLVATRSAHVRHYHEIQHNLLQ